MNLTRGAQAILREIDDADIEVPSLVERLEVAASGGRSTTSRSIAAPYYLTDLGVRRVGDPSVYFQAATTALALATTITSTEVLSELSQAPLDELEGLLDACILLLGDYETCVTVVGARASEIESGGSSTLLIYSGVLMAAMGDPACRRFLLAVGTCPDLDVSTSVMALHRLAAAEIKRFQDINRGLELLRAADAEVIASRELSEITHADSEALLSLIENLRALAYLRAGDGRAAFEAVSSAKLRMPNGGFSVLTDGEAARYKSQESINVAQLLVAREDFYGAALELLDNAEFCERVASEYLGEALSALAYCGFLAAQHEKAKVTALRAIDLVSREGSPDRLKTISHILAGILVETGFRRAASQVLDINRRDPLGLRPHLYREAAERE